MSGPIWHRRWDPFQEIQREVGRILGSFEPPGWRVSRPFPAINLYDAGDRFVLMAELPGVQPEEMELSVSDDALTLRGERKRPEGVVDESYRRQERPFGRWSRTVTLPERVQSSEAAAEFANGILTVSMPKSEQARPRTITVRTKS